MRLPILLALALATASGCTDEEARVVQSGGGGGGGGGGGVGGNSDAGPSGSDANVELELSGSVCLVTDMRTPFLCPQTTSLEGIEIRIAGTTISTLSSASGAFSLAAPGIDTYNLQIAYGDTDGYRDVLMPVSVSSGGVENVRLPAIPDSFWLDLTTAVGVAESSDSTGLAVYFQSSEPPFAPISGVELSAVGANATLYDGPLGINDWSPSGLTGASGTALVLGLPNDTATTQFDVSGALSARTISDVPIDPNVLTIVQIITQ